MKRYFPRIVMTTGALIAVASGGLVGCASDSDLPDAEVPSMAELSSEYMAEVSSVPVPSDLAVALDRDLQITPMEFLQDGMRAQRAGEVLAYLDQHTALDTTTAFLEGGKLFIHADNPGGDDLALVERVGAYIAGPGDSPSKPAVPTDATSSVQTAASVVGGLPIVRSVNGAAQMMCSIGFAGYAGGTPTLLTSGICGSSTDPLYLGTTSQPQGSLGIGQALGVPRTDAGLNEPEGIGLIPVGAGNTAAPEVSTWGTNGTGSPATTTLVKGRAAAVVGAPICKSSYQTGWRCGTVLAIVDGKQGDGFTKFEQIVADLCAVKGEVGSAAISGTNAVGLLTASSWSENCDASDQFAPNPYTTFTALQSTSGRPSVRTAAPAWTPAVSITPASLQYRAQNAGDRIQVKVQNNVGIPLSGSAKWTTDSGSVTTYSATCLETGVCSASSGSSGWTTVAFTITFPSGQSSTYTERYYLKPARTTS